MKMHNPCFPCIARGALDAACLATDDEALQLEILKAVLAKLSVLDPETPPPLMARFSQAAVAEKTGVRDPYARLKDEYNQMALDIYPRLQRLKAESGKDRFDTGVRLAIAGNIIDFGAASSVGEKKVRQTIDHALKTEVQGSIGQLRQAVEDARRILWLADNAGEIVFDRLLLEEMDAEKVIYAVRGGPIQNDAVMADALDAGLTDMVRVMDSGAAIPGTLPGYCSEAFVRAYERADLIISKGQGNFETLPLDDPRIFFLFKVKCRVVADHAGCRMGDVVVRQGSGA